MQHVLLIRGYFDADPGCPAPRVLATVELPGIRGIKPYADPIDFLIDTGASHTVLHPTDAINRVGIKRPRLQHSSNWSKIQTSVGVGGTATFYVVSCRFSFLHEDGSVLTIAGQLYIAQSAGANDALPSLLGRDILQHFVLTVSPARQEVSLDPTP